MGMNYLAADAIQVNEKLKEFINVYENDIMGRVFNKGQETIEYMAKSWISINGKKAVNKTTDLLNENLETISTVLVTLFNNIKSEVKYMIRSADGDICAGHITASIEKINKSYNSNEAKENIDGKFYIYVDELKKVDGKLNGYKDELIRYLGDIKNAIRNMDLEGGYEEVKNLIENAISRITNDINEKIAEITTDITAIINKQTSDAIQAKENATKRDFYTK